jgi:hypothetical protein
MANESAIQVVFKPEEAAQIKAIAKGMHMSASAYIRAQVLSRSAPLVLGWWCYPFDSGDKSKMLQRNTGVGRMANQHPDFILERVNQHPDGTAEYKVFHPTQEPLTYRYFQSTNWHTQGFDRGRVMLNGSHRLMVVISSVEDIRLGGQLRWTLAPDPELPDRS